MLPADLRVNPADVEAAARPLRTAGTGIRSDGAEVNAWAGRGSGLTGDGSAGGAFDHMVSSWARELAHLGGYVVSLGGGASAAATNYTVTEYGVSEMFGGTRG